MGVSQAARCQVVNIRGNSALSACRAPGRIERVLARKCISQLNGKQSTRSGYGGAAYG